MSITEFDHEEIVRDHPPRIEPSWAPRSLRCVGTLVRSPPQSVEPRICGIAGFQGKGTIADARRMIERIAYRGPDLQDAVMLRGTPASRTRG